MTSTMAPHDVAEWIYTLLPVGAVFVATVVSLAVWRSRRAQPPEHRVEPEELLRARHAEGQISDAELERRLASFRSKSSGR